MNPPATVEVITDRIFVVRGHKVIVDADLAALYGTTTKRLNEQVKRNQKRCPADFMRPVEAWEACRRLPLTVQEAFAIAANVAPYLHA